MLSIERTKTHRPFTVSLTNTLEFRRKRAVHIKWHNYDVLLATEAVKHVSISNLNAPGNYWQVAVDISFVEMYFFTLLPMMFKPRGVLLFLVEIHVFACSGSNLAATYR